MLESAVDNGPVELVFEEEVLKASAVNTCVRGNPRLLELRIKMSFLLLGGISVFAVGVLHILIGWEEVFVVAEVWLVVHSMG